MTKCNYPGGVHEYADLFPMMVGEDWSAFLADIQAHGQRDPILVTSDGLLVDGRNRWQACTDLGIDPRFETLGDMTEVEVLDLIVSKNLRRRELTTWQKAEFALAYKERFAKASGARSDLAPGGARLGEGQRRPKALAKAAKIAGVGSATVERYARVKRDTPDLVEQVQNDEISLNKADEIRGRRMLAQQAGTAQASGRAVGERIGALPTTPARGGRSNRKQVAGIISQLKAAGHGAELVGPEAFDAEAAEEFDKAISKLNSFRRKLKKND